MQSLGLNLASRPFRNNVLLWLGYGTAVLGLAAFTWYSATTYVEHRDKLDALRNQLDTSESRTQTLRQRAETADNRIDAYDIETLQVQAAKANEIIEWKAFSWTELFNRLAEIQPYDVKMTEVRPVFRGRGMDDRDAAAFEDDRLAIPVEVEGLAKDIAPWLEFQDALFKDPQFGRVEPRRWSRTQDTREIAFTVGFLYYPDSASRAEELQAEGGPADSTEVAEAADAADGPDVVEVPDEPAPAPEATSDDGEAPEAAVEVEEPGFEGDAAAAEREVEPTDRSPARRPRTGGNRAPARPAGREDGR